MVEGSADWKGIVQLSVQDGRDTVRLVSRLPNDPQPPPDDRKKKRSSERAREEYMSDDDDVPARKWATWTSTLLASDGEGRIFFTAGHDILVMDLPESLRAARRRRGGSRSCVGPDFDPGRKAGKEEEEAAAAAAAVKRAGASGEERLEARTCWQAKRTITGLAFVRPRPGPAGERAGIVVPSAQQGYGSGCSSTRRI
ncbi:hypothetical protein HYH03_010778 [Edaphochlamys debaryana]|uniref:Uncharacterized protein n=1 Tax=Edaphochlamys debaryana TaxID=47281 RepID=A0A835XW16_9CHLO|nr:hypothetical protein HYH03_010778 [Edaphochlamys debaryana]|eukprot:KAG2490860.1 hypothetical protein HYH03_010778 [Edaphochlamys debaryana]